MLEYCDKIADKIADKISRLEMSNLTFGGVDADLDDFGSLASTTKTIMVDGSNGVKYKITVEAI